MTKKSQYGPFMTGTVLGFVLAALALFVAGLKGVEMRASDLWPNVWFVTLFSLVFGGLFWWSSSTWRRKK